MSSSGGTPENVPLHERFSDRILRMASVPQFGRGWIADLPDPRDWSTATPEIRAAVAQLKRRRSPRAPQPSSVDLREYCLPPSDQGSLRACSVHAAIGLVGYFERRASGRLLDASPRFLYHTARKLDGIVGDNGVGLRSTIKALVRFGCPPVRHWPDDVAAYDAEPDAFAYGFAREFAVLRYARLDDRNLAGSNVLARVRAYLAAGWACVCGATVPFTPDATGGLAYPTRFAEPSGGAAFTVVGYDDQRRIRSTRGALLVCGTAGSAFGEAGYAWLPYRYVEERLAIDFWTVWNPAWTASGEFEQPREP